MARPEVVEAFKEMLGDPQKRAKFARSMADAAPKLAPWIEAIYEERDRLRRAVTDMLDHDDGNRLNLKEITEIGEAALKGETPKDTRIQDALKLAVEYGGIDGAHHKDWVIDQMVRALTGCQNETVVKHEGTPEEFSFDRQGESAEYQELVRAAMDGEDGPATYSWETGIAP